MALTRWRSRGGVQRRGDELAEQLDLLHVIHVEQVDIDPVGAGSYRRPCMPLVTC
jgi:hypothetical protein